MTAIIERLLLARAIHHFHTPALCLTVFHYIVSMMCGHLCPKDKDVPWQFSYINDKHKVFYRKIRNKFFVKMRQKNWSSNRIMTPKKYRFLKIHQENIKKVLVPLSKLLSLTQSVEEAVQSLTPLSRTLLKPNLTVYLF